MVGQNLIARAVIATTVNVDRVYNNHCISVNMARSNRHPHRALVDSNWRFPPPPNNNTTTDKTVSVDARANLIFITSLIYRSKIFPFRIEESSIMHMHIFFHTRKMRTFLLFGPRNYFELMPNFLPSFNFPQVSLFGNLGFIWPYNHT